MSNYMPGCEGLICPWGEEDEVDTDDMMEPCECPKCGSVHELRSAMKCRLCGGLFCHKCMDSLIGNVCLNCADEMESDTL